MLVSSPAQARRVGALAAVVAVAVVVLAAPRGLQGQGFRSNVDAVAIYPLVSGADGRLVTDLTRTDFTVLDNGKPADLAIFSSDTQPITAVLMLDTSASMEDRLGRVRLAADRFVQAMRADPADQLRIGTFGAEVALSPHLTSDRALLTRVLTEEVWPGGTTPLWKALDAGMASIAGQSGRRTIVVVTDGLDTTNTTYASVVQRAIAGPFMLYAIGFEGRGLGPRLAALIQETGGAAFDLKTSEDFGTAFERIAAELRHQYLLGFTPVALDGLNHTLEVRVNRPGLRVRAPRQFIAPQRK